MKVKIIFCGVITSHGRVGSFKQKKVQGRGEKGRGTFLSHKF